MTPRTLDVPELSTIEPTETLRQWRARVAPRKPHGRIRVLIHALTTWR